MKIPDCKILFAISVLLVFSDCILASGAKKNDDKTLFKIGRSKDANEIYYSVKTTSDGSLDLSNPIHIYWIKFTKDGVVEPLTRIQNAFAYGLKFLKLTPEKADFQFVSYANRTFSLRKTKAGNFSVFTTNNGTEVEVERIFIQIDGGTFWLPKIPKVELHSRIPVGGDPLVEIIIP